MKKPRITKKRPSLSLGRFAIISTVIPIILIIFVLIASYVDDHTTYQTFSATLGSGILVSLLNDFTILVVTIAIIFNFFYAVTHRTRSRNYMKVAFILPSLLIIGFGINLLGKAIVANEPDRLRSTANQSLCLDFYKEASYAPDPVAIATKGYEQSTILQFQDQINELNTQFKEVQHGISTILSQSNGPCSDPTMTAEQLNDIKTIQQRYTAIEEKSGKLTDKMYPVERIAFLKQTYTLEQSGSIDEAYHYAFGKTGPYAEYVVDTNCPSNHGGSYANCTIVWHNSFTHESLTTKEYLDQALAAQK